MNSFANMLMEEDEYESRIVKNVVLERWDTDIFEEIVVSLIYNPISREVDLATSLNDYLCKGKTEIYLAYTHLNYCSIHYFNGSLKCYEEIGFYPLEKEVFIKY